MAAFFGMQTDGLAWWRHLVEIFSALLAICAGNSPVTGEFLAQSPMTRSFGVFFDLHLNKRLSKQSWGWWFQTPLRPLWSHCNMIEWWLCWISITRHGFFFLHKPFLVIQAPWLLYNTLLCNTVLDKICYIDIELIISSLALDVAHKISTRRWYLLSSIMIENGHNLTYHPLSLSLWDTRLSAAIILIKGDGNSIVLTEDRISVKCNVSVLMN